MSKPHQSVELEYTTSNPIQPQQCIIDLTTITEFEGQPKLLNSFEFEDTMRPKKALEFLCKGYTIAFSNGKSPHTSYPFALHDTLVLPWDYSLKNGMMILFA